ncbi:MAG: 16S rRNA (guanine(527)-N(7))-methyltransferase RsmG [Desulforhopalus sp.]
MVDFSSQIEIGLQRLGLEISAKSYDRLALYFTELKKWSAKINLIAKSASNEHIIETHFLDSLTILPLLLDNKCHLLDIGTGAGFPGLVCKAVLPELAVTLVEPRLKRVSFLQHIVRILDLKEVDILSCRIEDETRLSSHTRFSHITGRAVTEVGPFLEMVERFSPSGAKVLLMKGPKWQEEIDAAAKILETSSYGLVEVVECALPFSGAKRALLLFAVKKTIQ